MGRERGLPGRAVEKSVENITPAPALDAPVVHVVRNPHLQHLPFDCHFMKQLPPSHSNPDSAHNTRTTAHAALSMGLRALLGVLAVGVGAIIVLVLLLAALALSVGWALRALIARLRGKAPPPSAMGTMWSFARRSYGRYGAFAWPSAAHSTHTVRTDEGDEVIIVDAPTQQPSPSSAKRSRSHSHNADITDVQERTPTAPPPSSAP